jgi:hypothetical protein
MTSAAAASFHLTWMFEILRSANGTIKSHAHTIKFIQMTW